MNTPIVENTPQLGTPPFHSFIILDLNQLIVVQSAQGSVEVKPASVHRISSLLHITTTVQTAPIFLIFDYPGDSSASEFRSYFTHLSLISLRLFFQQCRSLSLLSFSLSLSTSGFDPGDHSFRHRPCSRQHSTTFTPTSPSQCWPLFLRLFRQLQSR